MDAPTLARKYRTLLALRLGQLEQAALRALSAEFPGALRELDELPTEEIQRRIDLLEAGMLAPELRAIARFHELLRARVGMRGGVGSKPSRAALEALAAELAISPLEAHHLVFPFAHVRRGL